VNYVLDTHVLIWYFTGSKRLKRRAREAIDDCINEKAAIIFLCAKRKIHIRLHSHINHYCSFFASYRIYSNFDKRKLARSDIIPAKKSWIT